MNRKAFTIIELLLVIVIISLLTSGIVVISSNIVRRSNISAMLKTEDFIVEQLKRYYDMEGRLPPNQETFEAFLSDLRYFASYPSTILCDKWQWVCLSEDTGILSPAIVKSSDILIPDYARQVDMSSLKRTTVYIRETPLYGGDG